MPAATLRRYQPNDEDASVALWLRTWQPLIRSLISPNGSTGGASAGERALPVAEVVIAEADGTIIGFVTVDPRTFYLDQIVVAPEIGVPALARR